MSTLYELLGVWGIGLGVVLVWISLSRIAVWCVERTEVRGWWGYRGVLGWIVFAPGLLLSRLLRWAWPPAPDKSPATIDEILYGPKPLQRAPERVSMGGMDVAGRTQRRSVGHPSTGLSHSPYEGSSAPTPEHDIGYPEISDPGISVMRREAVRYASALPLDECRFWHSNPRCPPNLLDWVNQVVNSIHPYPYSRPFVVDAELMKRMLDSAINDQIDRLDLKEKYGDKP